MSEEEKAFATDYDGPWKDALDFAPGLFLKRFLPEIVLQTRKLEKADGFQWYRLIDWLMKLPKEMNRQVYKTVFQQQTEEAMKYVSFAERHGMLKGLRAVLEAKFGAEGIALMEHLDEDTDLVRLDVLTRESAVARSLDEIRGRFEAPNGNA